MKPESATEWIYHLNVIAANCVARVWLNGFLAVEIAEQTRTFRAPAINQLLIGKGNTLKAEALALSAIGRPAYGALLKGTIARYRRGDIVVPGESGDVIVRFDVHEPEQGIEYPLRSSAQFDSDGPSFRHLLLGIDVYDDQRSLYDYAMQLRDIVRVGNVDAFVEECRPKMKDFARAYHRDSAESIREMSDFMRTRVFPQGMVTDFERGDIALVAHCGGRIWELRLKPNESFITTRVNSEGSHFEIPVYVARIGDALKIIR